jgi:serine phosphatase RsbU (regulator of sigma subunit)
MNLRRGEGLRKLQAGISKQSPFSIALFDGELRILWVNATMSAAGDVPRERWVGRGICEMLPSLEAAEVDPMLRRVLETGERVVDVEHRGPRFGDPGSSGVWGCSAFRLEGADGAVLGVALIAGDVTERSRDRERLAVLNEASGRIGSTLDIVRTANETLDVLIPRIGDCGYINLLSHVLDGGPQPRFSGAGDDLRLMVTAVRWLPGRPVPELIRKGSASFLDAPSLYYRWLAEGRTIFAPRLSDPPPELDEMLRSESLLRRFRMLREAGVHSGLTVPIAARGVVLGTVSLFRMRQPEISEEEVALTEDVLARSAICLDNARVYSRERATALELQRSMLPQGIGQTPGVDLAYRYEPANTAAEIGGDWFDVVHQSNGCIALIVGDVTGHDIHAASLMGQIRTVTRTLATLDLSPVQVLTRLDTMVSDMGTEVGATCIYAAFNPESRHCVMARAGHPLPALVRPTGEVDFLDLPAGLPLGVGGAAFESVRLVLEPGSVLVLYTDGLIETRDAGIDVGMDRLARALADGSAEPFGPRHASTLINRLVADPADDIAVLMARIKNAEGAA